MSDQSSTIKVGGLGDALTADDLSLDVREYVVRDKHTSRVLGSLWRPVRDGNEWVPVMLVGLAGATRYTRMGDALTRLIQLDAEWQWQQKR